MKYLLQGIGVLSNPGYRRFILIPIVANMILFGIITTFMWGIFSDTIGWALDWLPSWMDFVSWIMWPIMVSIFLIIYGLSFSFITNIFAAPFNGLLAEKIQREEGIVLPEGESLSSVISRTLVREFQKLGYFIWYGLWVTIGLVVLSWIPLVNLLVPVIAFVWGAWCLAIQYLDYAADNHQQSFKDLRVDAKKPMFQTLSFGGCVALLMMVPVVNIFVMPVAVAGATRFWAREIYHVNAMRDVSPRDVN
ncbi:MAG: sulfate transporter CysZ [Bermanella sp.]